MKFQIRFVKTMNFIYTVNIQLEYSSFTRTNCTTGLSVANLEL